ncbi:MAG: hypothetical protein R3F56_02925 [Planctomycetota bacterium]
MGEHEISGIGRFSHFGQRLDERDAAPRRAARRQRFGGGDSVELSAPEVATLGLLRQSVLVRTRELLELDEVPAHPRFHELTRANADAFLGRLWGEQAQLASARDGQWEAARTQRALHDAMTLGVEDTLGMLCEQDQLDEPSWRLLCDVLDAWARKVEHASGGST